MSTMSQHQSNKQNKSNSFWRKVKSGVSVSTVLTANTIMHGSAILSLGLTKLVKKSEKIDQTNVKLANNWIKVNNQLIDQVLTQTEWDIRIADDLQLKSDGRYIMICNHQSWVDTTVNQYFVAERMPLTRFFTKWELIFIPFAGQAFKILGFPMMKRHSKAQIAKNPSLKNRDKIEARKACEQLLSQPFTLLNYLEGTRFTTEKHQQQQSPYQHLLKPKAGGLALALSILGEHIDGVIDMTIVYPDGVAGYGEFWLGDVPKIIVDLRKVDLPTWINQGNYEDDEHYRQQFQAWVDGVWQQKDQLIQQIKQDYAEENQRA